MPAQSEPATFYFNSSGSLSEPALRQAVTAAAHGRDQPVGMFGAGLDHLASRAVVSGWRQLPRPGWYAGEEDVAKGDHAAPRCWPGYGLSACHYRLPNKSQKIGPVIYGSRKNYESFFHGTRKNYDSILLLLHLMQCLYHLKQ
jgi:hypothetical protein